MSANLRRLLEESIKLESNIAELYFSFHSRFQEDASFWWNLALEEKCHASLLMSGEQRLLDTGLFPAEIVGESLEALVDMNGTLEGMLRQEKEAPPSKAVAFNLALKLEESAGEIHFQYAMRKTELLSEALKSFQRLNEDDKNHADRIRNYMHQNGIAIARN